MTTFQQKAYADTAAQITFKESGGSAVITLKNLGFGAGRVSAQYDRGAGAKPSWFEVRATLQWEDHPAASDVGRIAVVDHDGTTIPGGLGTADAAVAIENALTQGGGYAVLVPALAAAGSTDRIARRYVWITHRYVSVGVWNGSATKNLKNSDNVSVIELVPIVEVLTDA